MVSLTYAEQLRIVKDAFEAEEYLKMIDELNYKASSYVSMLKNGDIMPSQLKERMEELEEERKALVDLLNSTQNISAMRNLMHDHMLQAKYYS